MRKTGIAELPLHYGRAPLWLVTRMKKLANEIVTIIVDEYGRDELLWRLSNPVWFQALGCVLGYDWHSSGVTTVVTGVLKSVIKPEEHGLAVAGGKGKISLQTPIEIGKIGDTFNLSTQQIRSLIYASRMSAKVDNSAIQAGYPLYHHAFFVAENGRWVVIQQGMNTEDKTARRYHWFSDHVKSFVNEPHDAIVGDLVKPNVLNMTARDSEECRKISTDLVKDGFEKVKRNFTSLRPTHQRTLREWMCGETVGKDYAVHVLSMPRNINWEALKEAYEIQPRNYEELLSIRGIGPATVRGLALVSEIIYGAPPSWKDPVRYSFCVGGKDGVPFPVNKLSYDKIIEALRDAVNKAKVGDRDRLNALRRLSNFWQT
ncbi:DUF763 domain-containing protein [Candidatus Bathyarchaeota archaeon]|nr:DUF763 domain-containing protein [Candidatus Bathyarchaeota archaeon]